MRGHVRFENVDFGYVPGRPVIKDMTLEAKPGQTVALVGPTGAGKTTIINLLTRFYEIDGGQITIDGRTSATSAKPTCAASWAWCCRTPSCFPTTVMENIRYGRLDATDEEVHRGGQTGRCRSLHPPAARRATRPCSRSGPAT